MSESSAFRHRRLRAPIPSPGPNRRRPYLWRSASFWRRSVQNNHGRVWSALFRGSGGTRAHIVRQRKISNEDPPGSF
ncbi:hypothetical protein CDEST_14567 [Colletotrichum destructivum]|uniref:Uncharacterized protein n=1 Tax=Colletotrichum destructivum TaxID=34406 RepID=A0AAX4J2E0_9PEZI|nr:hypothetical protein CDEST_14567 [Colletotrichum destructivum]